MINPLVTLTFWMFFWYIYFHLKYDILMIYLCASDSHQHNLDGGDHVRTVWAIERRAYIYMYRYVHTNISLQWRHNERGGVSNHQLHWSLNRLFRRRSKKTSKLSVTGFCEGNALMTGEFPAQRASNTENVSIWWRHHAIASFPTGQDRPVRSVVGVTKVPFVNLSVTGNFVLAKV